MSETVTANDGTLLDLGSLPQVFGYTGNLLTTITVQKGAVGGVTNTYVQTLTYTGTNLTNQSGWIKQ